MNTVYITGKHTGTEEQVAACEYGDDAELLFNHYKAQGFACRVVYTGMFSDEETLKCEAQP